jgi:uncharacterized protein YggE
MDTESQTSGCCSKSGLWHSKNVHGTVVLVLLLLAAFLFAETIKSFKEYRYVGGGIPTSNAITVTGEGEVFALPDTAEFTFSVIEEGDSVQAVQDAAAEKVNAALDAVREKGVADGDIKTTEFTLTPRYVWEPPQCFRFPCDRKRVQNGFSLTQSVRVKVKELETAGDVLEAVTATGVQGVSGLSFTIADEDEKQEEARKLAIEEAQSKAEKLAEDLGVTLVRIVGFSEDGERPMPFMARDMAAESMTVGMVDEAKGLEVPSGENRVVSNVRITYELR